MSTCHMESTTELNGLTAAFVIVDKWITQLVVMVITHSDMRRTRRLLSVMHINGQKCQPVLNSNGLRQGGNKTWNWRYCRGCEQNIYIQNCQLSFSHHIEKTHVLYSIVKGLFSLFVVFRSSFQDEWSSTCRIWHFTSRYHCDVASPLALVAKAR